MSRTMLLAVVVLIEARSAFAASATPIVYWDQSHTLPFVTVNGPEGRYSELANHLQTHGFSNVASTVPLTSVDLSPYDILVYGEAMLGFASVTDDEAQVIHDFVSAGGGLLLMSDIESSQGMNRLAGLFGVQLGISQFGALDIYSTRIDAHPVVENVNSIYFRFSSTFDPGILTPYAFYFSSPMLAAGRFGAGHVVSLADSDALGNRGEVYIDREDNRQLALSIFRYLAVPEPSTCSMLVLAFTLTAWSRCSRSRLRHAISNRVAVQQHR